MNTHARINALCAQARRLAPRAYEEAMDSGNTNPRPTGPRQARAWDLSQLAYQLNSWADDLPNADQAQDMVDRFGMAASNGTWHDEVVVHGIRWPRCVRAKGIARCQGAAFEGNECQGCRPERWYLVATV